jgi:hypothetical protein
MHQRKDKNIYNIYIRSKINYRRSILMCLANREETNISY